MHPTLRITVIPAVVALAVALPAFAAGGKTWTTSGTQQFASGKLEGVSVLATGELELAPQMEPVPGIEAGFVWDIKSDEAGSIYVATGAPGGVWEVRAGRAELIHETREKHVLSLLPLSDGTVLAATAPDGIVLRISRRGAVSTLVDLDVSYVWDMALGPMHEVYCATGPNGRLLRLNRAGEVTELLKVKQHNLLCVDVDSNGTLFAGTDTDGYLYRIDRDGQAMVVYDADENEVRDLVVVGPDEVYICTAQGESRRSAQPQPTAQRPQDGPMQSLTQDLPQPPSMQGVPAASNSIYRYSLQHGATRIAQFDQAFVLSLTETPGRLLAGVGPGGRLAAIDENQLVRILAQVDAAHITALAPLPDGTAAVGSSNSGGLWLLSPEIVKLGTFVSKPFDAGYLSHWGKVTWQQVLQTGQNVRVRVRTGNSSEPDEFWGKWSEWGNEPSGFMPRVPPGRFAQFSAELSSHPRLGSPRLIAVEVAYRQTNRRPAIEDIALDGESLLKPTANKNRHPPQARRAPPGQNGPKPARLVLAWKASDPNEDQLRYELHYRGTDESDWKELETDISGQNTYQWDTSRVPDGYYQVKLIASDDAVRAPETALFDTKITGPILVDNRPPLVAELAAEARPDGKYVLRGIARDAHGTISAIQVSRNSGKWQPVFPADGILDSGEEAFAHVTDTLSASEHVFVFAVTDSKGNTGSGKLVVTVHDGL